MNELYERFAAFIESEGHKVEIERYGENDRGADLAFRSTGKIYRVRIDRTDDAYFAVTIGYRYESEQSHEARAKAALETGAAIKCAKIELREAGYESTVEQFFGGPDGYQSIFWRCVHIAQMAATDFQSRIDKAPPADPVADAKGAAERFVSEFLRGSEGA